MATSVQSIPIASSRMPDFKVVRPTRTNGGFAASLKQAEGSQNRSPVSPDLVAKDPQATDPHPVVLNVDGPITNTTMADVVAKAVKGRIPQPTDDAPPEKKAASIIPQPTTILDDEAVDAEKSVEEPTEPSDNEATRDPEIAVTYAAAGEAQALRCGLPSSILLAAGDKPGVTPRAGNKPTSLSDAPELEKTAPPKAGELVFQLSLQSAAEPAPTDEGRPLPKKNGGTPQTGRALDVPELPAPAPENPIATKTGVAMEMERPATKPAGAAERMQDAIPQESASKVALENLREGSAPPQGLAFAPGRGATTTASDHSSPQSATPPRTEPLVPVAPQLPATSVLQRMDLILRGTDQVVRLDIRQSMGSVKVAVHSDDAALAVRLRDSLPELLNKLDDRGLQARVMSFGSSSQILPSARTESGNTAGKDSDGWAGGDTSRQQRQQQEHRERNQQRAWRAATWKLHEE
jgi:hypothetical protein